jgi:hypothetical protein
MLDLTPVMRLYAARRLAQLHQQDGARAQERQLLRLVRQAAGTDFGKAHGFGGIASVDAFQQAVPLRRYEAFWQEWWQPRFPHLDNVSWPKPIKYFAVSSGTTSGKTKYIPVSSAMRRANQRAVLDLLSFHLAAQPHSHFMGGKSFMLGGSTSLVTLAEGIYSGDLSGIGASRLPAWARGRYFPPADLAKITDWDEKVSQLVPLSLGEDIRLIGGTASWLLAFIEQALDQIPNATRLADLYPQLELLVHGGVNFAPYQRRFTELLAGSHAETREAYAASEGFIAVADAGSGEGLRLLLDNGLFFEFVPLEELDSPNPARHWLKTAELDRNYAIVLSSCAGLWSYILGDTVRFVSLDPARIVVTGRTSYSLSAFGEHLIGEEIEAAVAGMAAALGLHVVDYAVGALYPDGHSAKGRHLFLIEFSELADPALLPEISRLLDTALADENLDYREHRLNDVQMLPPEIRLVPPGQFAAWMKSRGKLGAQNKVPRIINDPELFAGLQAFMRQEP